MGKGEKLRRVVSAVRHLDDGNGVGLRDVRNYLYLSSSKPFNDYKQCLQEAVRAGFVVVKKTRFHPASFGVKPLSPARRQLKRKQPRGRYLYELFDDVDLLKKPKTKRRARRHDADDDSMLKFRKDQNDVTRYLMSVARANRRQSFRIARTSRRKNIRRVKVNPVKRRSRSPRRRVRRLDDDVLLARTRRRKTTRSTRRKSRRASKSRRRSRGRRHEDDVMDSARIRRPKTARSTRRKSRRASKSRGRRHADGPEEAAFCCRRRRPDASSTVVKAEANAEDLADSIPPEDSPSAE